MIKERVLQRIANTIIANLNNADGIGLLYGKMGLALFLYRNSEFINSQLYSDIADTIIDDIYAKMNDAIPCDYARGLAGIGCGMCRILKEKYAVGDPSVVLEAMDERLLENAEDTLKEDVQSNSPVYSSGLYLLDRLSLEQIVDSQKKSWISKVVRSIETLDFSQSKDGQSRVLLISSMLYVLSKISSAQAIDSERIYSLCNYLIKCALQSVIGSSGFGVLLLKKVVELFPEDKICQVQLLSVKELSLNMDVMNRDILFETELNWYWIYDISLSLKPSITDCDTMVSKALIELEFDVYTANSKLAKLGTWIMNMY